MKTTAVLRGLCIFAVWIVAGLYCSAQTSTPQGQASQKPTTLEQRVAAGDSLAMLEAADANRKDLIPTIEKFAGNDDAQQALARLGVKKYLDEFLRQATDPANSLPYKEEKKSPTFTPSRYRILWIQMEAFQKLHYIKDRSSVKVLIALLPRKENPADYVLGGDGTFTSPSEMAMQTLAQIVDSPPEVNLPPDNETHDARVKIWQQWWEQNKDKYP